VLKGTINGHQKENPSVKDAQEKDMWLEIVNLTNLIRSLQTVIITITDINRILIELKDQQVIQIIPTQHNKEIKIVSRFNNKDNK